MSLTRRSRTIDCPTNTHEILAHRARGRARRRVRARGSSRHSCTSYRRARGGARRAGRAIVRVVSTVVVATAFPLRRPGLPSAAIHYKTSTGVDLHGHRLLQR